jgi:hypothetical protein
MKIISPENVTRAAFLSALRAIPNDRRADGTFRMESVLKGAKNG